MSSISQTSSSQLEETVNKSEETYASTVLQSLCILNSISSDFKSYEPRPSASNNRKLTEAFKVFLYGNFNSINNSLFQDLIKIYNEYAQNTNDAVPHNPYNFLKHFIIFLNTENNNVKDVSFFQLYEQQKRNVCNSFDGSVSLFEEYCRNTQDSIISKNFYYSEITNIICNNCGSKIFNCSLNPLIEIDIQRYISQRPPELSQGNITLKECLNYYINSNPSTCPNCQNNASMFKLLINDSKTLIFYLNRNTHNGFNDINFDLELDVSNCFNKDKTKSKVYTKYDLRACLCYSGNYGYFVDYNIKGQNGNIWFRFNNQYKRISINELYVYEPIILIYESSENNKNYLGGNNSNQANKNGFNNNQQPANMAQMNMQMNNTNQLRVNNNNMNAVNPINQISQMNQMNAMNQMNNMNRNNQMNQMNAMNPMNQMNTMNAMNAMNPMNQMNTMNAMNPMNQMNAMNPMNQMNPMNAMNQMNQMNPMNQMNRMNMMNQMNAMNQMNVMNQLRNTMNSPMSTLANMTQFTQINQQNIFQNNNFSHSCNNVKIPSNTQNNPPPSVDINVIFKMVNENDLQNEQFKLAMQLKSDEKIKDIMAHLFMKLDKPDDYIKKFLLNGIEIPKNSILTASETNLIDDSEVIAVLSKPENRNNNNNNANANNNSNDNNNNNNNANANNTG